MLERIFNILNSIEGFEGKVAYRFFPEGEAPNPPFICYLEVQTDNFTADNKVYRKCQEMDIEFYSDYKDVHSEELIEQALFDNEIIWEKYEEYIKDEKMFEIVYTIQL